MTTHAPQAGADSCWSRIGVTGDLSCERLAEQVHCRNCDVYAGAAQRTLERPVGAAYRAQWAGHLRQPLAAPEASDASALVFRVGAEWLAVPTAMVSAVAPLAPVHRLPHRSGGALLGIVNVGGRLTPALSLAALLAIDERDVQAAAGRHVFARLLVVECAGQPCALPVAELKGIVRYAAAGLATPAATINKGLARYLAGVLAHGALRVGVLDAALLGRQCAQVLR